MPRRTVLDAVDPQIAQSVRAKRLRSDGPLSGEEVAFCQRHSIPLAFDPLQFGWVRQDVVDDITDDDDRRTPYSAAIARAAAARLRFRSATFNMRRWTDADVQRYVELLDNPRMWRYLPEPYPSPLTSDMAADLIRISNDLPYHKVRAVERDGEIVGQVRLLFKDLAATEAEISYWVGEPYWGQGVAGMIIPEYTAEAFERHAKLRSIVAHVHPDNTASARALQAAGYRHDGQAAHMLVFRIDRAM